MTTGKVGPEQSDRPLEGPISNQSLPDSSGSSSLAERNEQTRALDGVMEAMDAGALEKARKEMEWQRLLTSVSGKLDSLKKKSGPRDADWLRRLLDEIDELDRGRAFLPGEARRWKDYVRSHAGGTLDESGYSVLLGQLREHGVSPAEIERTSHEAIVEADQGAPQPAVSVSGLRKEMNNITREMVEQQATPEEMKKALNEKYLSSIGKK